jgi:chromosome segregation ATPase
MLKKAIIGVGVLLVLAFVAWQTEVGSYVFTAFKEGRAYCKQQVPIEFEIKRAKDMLGNLEKVDDKLISALATEMVNKKKLEREVAEGEVAVAAARDTLRARNEAFKTIPVGAKSHQRETLAIDLERQFKRLKTMETTLKTKKELLAQHDERVNAVKEQRDGLKAQKVDLQARVEGLETQVALLKAAEARSRHRIDDTQLGELSRVKELVDSLEERIEKSMTELQLREDIKASAPTASPSWSISSGSLAQEIDSYLGASAGHVAVEK